MKTTPGKRERKEFLQHFPETTVPDFCLRLKNSGMVSRHSLIYMLGTDSECNTLFPRCLAQGQLCVCVGVYMCVCVAGLATLIQHKHTACSVNASSQSVTVLRRYVTTQLSDVLLWRIAVSSWNVARPVLYWQLVFPLFTCQKFSHAQTTPTSTCASGVRVHYNIL